MIEHHDEHEHEHHQEVHPESVFEVFTDPAHLVAELMFESIFFVIGALYVRFKLRRRDRAHRHAQGDVHG